MDRRLIWLAIGAFATSTVAFVFAGLLPLIADGVGTTVPKAGLLMTAFSLSYAIGTPILATVTGSVDRRRVIAFALAFFIAANLFAATAASYGGTDGGADRHGRLHWPLRLHRPVDGDRAFGSGTPGARRFPPCSPEPPSPSPSVRRSAR